MGGVPSGRLKGGAFASKALNLKPRVPGLENLELGKSSTTRPELQARARHQELRTPVTTWTATLWQETVTALFDLGGDMGDCLMFGKASLFDQGVDRADWGM